MVKTKKWQMLIIGALLIIGIMFGGISKSTTTMADVPVAATYVSTDTSTLAAWESAGYGQNGYLIFDGYRNGAGAGFYSDMYNIGTSGTTGTTVAKTTLMQISGAAGSGWSPATSGGWDLTKNDDGTIAMNSTTKTTTTNSDAHTIKSDAVISSWGVNATVFQGHGTRPRKPNIPDSITQTQLRLQTTNDNNTLMADVNIGFTLNTTEKVDVTLYVYDHADAIASPNIVVAVYGLAYQGGRYTYTKVQKDIASCYGDGVLASTTVSSNGAYVTFTLDGSVAQDYTFVAYRGDSTATTSFPSIGGVFFDECKGAVAPVAAVASFSGYNVSVNGSQWESAGYGKDGYIIYYTENGSTYQAYTKGIYKESDDSDYTGLVTYTGAVKKAHNEWVADKELSGKLVTRYANAFEEFSTIAEKSWKDEYKTGVLTIPGSEDPTWTRVSTPRNTGNGVTAFTIPEKAFENHTALEVTIFHATAFGPSADTVAPVFPTAIYNMYNCGDGDSNNVGGTPLASATVSLAQHTPLYITYRITTPGDYTIYLFDYEGVVRATTTGIFFDYVDEGIGQVEYELDGGENNAYNPTYYSIGKATALADATKEGYTFVGWYKDAEFAQKVTEISADQTDDLTLYAKFVKMNRTFNITYVTENGTHTNPATYTEGTAVILSDATKIGYTFVGWYADIAFTQEVTEISATQTGDLMLFAKFERILETFNITYDVDGGTHTNPATYTEGTAVTLNDATKEGYTFEGWYLEATFENQVTTILSTQTGDITLYAKFTRNVVNSNITYVLDGGVNGSNPTTYTEGTAVTLNDATKEGYTFEGWYLEAAFENKVTAISAEQTGDITLYAKFVENTTGDNINDATSGCGCAGYVNGPGFLGLGALTLFALAIMIIKKRKEN